MAKEIHYILLDLVLDLNSSCFLYPVAGNTLSSMRSTIHWICLA